MERSMENNPESNVSPAGSIIKGIQGLSANTPPGNESHLKSIHLSADGLIIMDEPVEIANEVAGVYVKGIQYYDLQNVHFINNTGMAHLIDLLRSLLEHGTEVKFVNASEEIKNKIRTMGLDHILNCC
jgi:ABC-type transporter Mla MlaB component